MPKAGFPMSTLRHGGVSEPRHRPGGGRTFSLGDDKNWALIDAALRVLNRRLLGFRSRRSLARCLGLADDRCAIGVVTEYPAGSFPHDQENVSGSVGTDCCCGLDIGDLGGWLLYFLSALHAAASRTQGQLHGTGFGLVPKARLPMSSLRHGWLSEPRHRSGSWRALSLGEDQNGTTACFANRVINRSQLGFRSRRSLARCLGLADDRCAVKARPTLNPHPHPHPSSAHSSNKHHPRRPCG